MSSSDCCFSHSIYFFFLSFFFFFFSLSIFFLRGVFLGGTASGGVGGGIWPDETSPEKFRVYDTLCKCFNRLIVSAQNPAVKQNPPR